MVKNPNWQEANQVAIYKARPRIWTRDFKETNPANDRVDSRPWTQDLRITTPAP